MPWRARLDHLATAAAVAPGWLLWPARRRLLDEMRQLCRQLPVLMKLPLPRAMVKLTPTAALQPLPGEATTRHLADLAALLERRSPLGLCLRRSLLRYHYLRQLELPLVLRFGARLTAGVEQRDMTGHAWLTLEGQPYHESAANYREFTVMVSWPDPESDGRG